MLYNSTQNAKEVVSAAQAIAQGISKDGGLLYRRNFLSMMKIPSRHF